MLQLELQSEFDINSCFQAIANTAVLDIGQLAHEIGARRSNRNESSLNKNYFTKTTSSVSDSKDTLGLGSRPMQVLAEKASALSSKSYQEASGTPSYTASMKNIQSFSSKTRRRVRLYKGSPFFHACSQRNLGFLMKQIKTSRYEFPTKGLTRDVETRVSASEASNTPIKISGDDSLEPTGSSDLCRHVPAQLESCRQSPVPEARIDDISGPESGGYAESHSTKAAKASAPSGESPAPSRVAFERFTSFQSKAAVSSQQSTSGLSNEAPATVASPAPDSDNLEDDSFDEPLRALPTNSTSSHGYASTHETGRERSKPNTFSSLTPIVAEALDHSRNTTTPSTPSEKPPIMIIFQDLPRSRIPAFDWSKTSLDPGNYLNRNPRFMPRFECRLVDDKILLVPARPRYRDLAVFADSNLPWTQSTKDGRVETRLTTSTCRSMVPVPSKSISTVKPTRRTARKPAERGTVDTNRQYRVLPTGMFRADRDGNEELLDLDELLNKNRGAFGLGESRNLRLQLLKAFSDWCSRVE